MPDLEAPKGSSAYRIGIVTVSYGSGDALTSFLKSLREFHGAQLPVVVVDNKPDHENVRDLAARFDAAYLALPENPGYGAGMNAGARALRDGAARSTPDFDAFFFCNPDVRFIAPAVQKLAQSLLHDPSAGSIGPRLLNEDGSTYPSARNIPSVSTGIGHALFRRIWPLNPWSRAYQNTADSDTRRAAGSLSGAAVMVRADLYDRIGGWDEAYFMHFEDTDLGWRIGRTGLTNIYEPNVAVVHTGAHSTKKHAVVVEQAMTRSAIRFLRKRYAGFWRSPLRWALVIGLRARGVLRVRAARRAQRRQEQSGNGSGSPTLL